MTGVVLCGGQSSRMNTDKGMLKVSEETWAQAAAGKLALLNIPVVLSVNSTQHNQYLSLFTSAQLITDNNTLELHGPLCGVLSVHLQYPSEDLFVLACDMPFMENNILQQLLAAQQHSTADAFVFTNDEQAEPLCGIYTAKGLTHILQLYRTGKLIRHSMKFMLEHIHTSTTALLEEQKKYFRNINTHAELNGL